MQSTILRIREASVRRSVHALSQLALLEQIRPGLMAGDLAALLVMPRPSIDRALSALESQGLIERDKEGSGADLRTRPIRVTADGDALLSKIREILATQPR